MTFKWLGFAGVLVAVAACSSSEHAKREFASGGNDGSGGSISPGSGGDLLGIAGAGIAGAGISGVGGAATTGAGGSANITPNGELTIVIRDFKLYNAGDATTNPDSENPPKSGEVPGVGWNDVDIVTDTLGTDQKPVYKNATSNTVTTHGKSQFDQWFRDVQGTNLHIDYPLKLTQDATGAFQYDSEKSGVPYSGPNGTDMKMFFPIDDVSPNATAWGNQGLLHNYSFTVELHTKFVYHGGEFFHFRGDDDVFVFINGKRVINLGGIHGPETADVQVDTLGLTKESEYPLDFFYAERHTGGSNMLLTTSLGLVPAMIN